MPSYRQQLDAMQPISLPEMDEVRLMNREDTEKFFRDCELERVLKGVHVERTGLQISRIGVGEIDILRDKVSITDDCRLHEQSHKDNNRGGISRRSQHH